MSVSTVRRAVGSLSNPKALFVLPSHLPSLMISRLLRITLSIILLPLNNAILIALYIWKHVSVRLSYPSSLRPRQTALQDVHFYPKTVLITGVDTPHGLAVARAWYAQGHRVVGAGVSISERGLIPSGVSLSTSVSAFYHIPRGLYASRLLDVVQREKIDIWIPCSASATAMDDAMAKEAIESRTSCVCITLGTPLVSRFARQDSFTQYLQEKDLPVVENHHVQSRDTIHKILHRSPTKVYRMRRPSAAMSDGHAVILPKRTVSLTYSEVSEIQISKDRPWVMQQQSRLGKFSAELLVVGGQVQAFRVFSVGSDSACRSRLDEGLATAIHKLMARFASKAGTQMTGHLSVQLMVDEEFDANHVRYVIHIAGCALGASATERLLRTTPAHTLVRGYLAVLAPQINGAPRLCDDSHTQPVTIESAIPPRKYSLYQTVRDSGIRRILPALYPTLQKVDKINDGLSDLLFFWKDWRFSSFDPLPWWWHTHVHQPWEDAERILREVRRSK
ncbi:hypothetical protein HFD88_010392 [Aspergillus terreus]|nr:hypothetical protein HFD88_010392 [Aspergillus terreus]